MKKLMFAAVAAVGLTTGFAIESDVVGYQDKTITPNTMNIACATFLPTDKAGENAVLGDIKVNENFVVAEDSLQLLNGNGGTLAMYTYCDAITAAEYAEFGLQEGWYDYFELAEYWDWESPLTYTLKNNVKIPFGTMFILQSGREGSGLIYSGSVLDEDKEFLIVPDTMNMLGNATPVDLNLGDILVNEKFVVAEDSIQFLNGNGGTLAMYTYCDATTAAEYAEFGLQEGWYDYFELAEYWDWESPLTYTQKNDVDVPAGCGFILQSGNEGSGIIIPAAL